MSHICSTVVAVQNFQLLLDVLLVELLVQAEPGRVPLLVGVLQPKVPHLPNGTKGGGIRQVFLWNIYIWSREQTNQRGLKK